MSDSIPSNPQGAPGLGAEQLAELFHDRYERLAPQFGYTTRTDTRRFDRGTENGKLMIAVCDEILTWFDLKVTADEIARLRAREKHMLEWLNYYRAKWMGEAAMPCPPEPSPLDLTQGYDR